MNRLADATSPYLLQHAENPVDWHAWGDEAFELARVEEKPLLVSVGYSSCHWCHVMAHESFEDPDTAALMNDLFVNVKVDREERPDVDAVTMEATVGMTGSGGWPTTVFMTPDGKPFYAGTYFPPEPRHGLASFRDLLRAVARAWSERRAEIERQAAQIDDTLRRSAELRPSTEPLTESILGEAARGIAGTFEPAFGGFGRAPKFPAASTLEFLLRRGDEAALGMVTKTLDEMAAGGMYDVVGGGFHRYSVDERWLVPHFEKMLYDNAVLASTYLHGWLVTGRPRYREIVEETIDYLIREMLLPDGGLSSAQDADTDGVEGLTYTWSADEAAASGIASELLEPFEHGRLVVRGQLEPELKTRLLAERARRPQPFRDDKVLASWNGLALAALAEAAYRLERADWLEVARGVGEFLLGPLSDADGRLLRSRRDGRASGAGFLDDYANVAYGLMELHVATGELRWLTRGSSARAPRDRSLRRRGARRLLSRVGGCRRAGAAHQGSAGHADPVRKLDAGLGAAPARPDLGRRRARAPRVCRSFGSSSPRSVERREASPGCSVGSISGSARRVRSRSPVASTRRWREPRSPRSSRARSSPSAPRREFRCSRARASWTASPPSTSASGSSARRPLRTRPLCAPDERSPARRRGMARPE